MLSKYKYHIWLHFTILIYGLTGILGKLISVDSGLLVWYRLLIAIVALLIYYSTIKFSLKISKQVLISTLLVGIIIAVHWITFFEAIKQSNVSIALVCFSSSTLFTSLIEPIYFKRRIKIYELIFGGIIILALYFIFSFEFKYMVGMILSFISAALASWFTVVNGILIKESNSKTITFYELLGAFVVTSIYMLFYTRLDFTQFMVPESDIKWLIILGIVCTAFAFLLGVEVMKQISPYTVTISVNLEPIYAILVARLRWPESETMSTGFYLGTLIVIVTIFLNAAFKKRGRESKEKKALQ
jgi:drug/metabolite transporter (DMT)-like permease